MKPETSLELMQQIMGRVVRRPTAPARISRETRFIDDLGMNSVELISFVVVCEREFGVTLMGRSDLFPRIASVGDALDYISQIRNEATSLPTAGTA